jgi:hypothetical protein
VTTTGPKLTAEQIEKLHRPIFTDALAKVAIAANGDPELQFALIRKMAKGFSYEERSTPAHRKRLKRQKYAEQNESGRFRGVSS